MRAIIYFIVFSTCLCEAIASSQPETYVINHPMTVDWNIIFPIPNAKSVFVSTATAIDIQSVSVDGAIIKPEVFVPANTPSPATTNARSDIVIYQASLGFLASWVDPDSNERLHYLKRFVIQTDAKIVTIQYRARYPDGSVSKTTAITFVGSYDTNSGLRVNESKGGREQSNKLIGPTDSNSR